MENGLTPEKIKSLWSDVNFEGYQRDYRLECISLMALLLLGHGLGLVSFKQELESRYNVKLSDTYLRKILLQIPDYIKNQLRRKKVDRRSYSVHGFGTLYQVKNSIILLILGYSFLILRLTWQ